MNGKVEERLSLCNILLNKSKPPRVRFRNTGDISEKGEYRAVVLISMVHCGISRFRLYSFIYY